MSQAAHVLLVEDDESLANWIFDYLSDNGFMVTIANRGDTALEMIRDDQPDLVILDVMLPQKNGHQVCLEARHFYHQPILILTANNEDSDEILGLEMGADDFLSKPVRPGVLLARINALLRRSGPATEGNILSFGSFVLDNNLKIASLEQQDIGLTSNEFDLLWILASKSGSVVSRAELTEMLRGIDYDGFNRSIDLKVSRLRKKLEALTQCPVKVRTVWGKGYIFSASVW